ncbi:hypothetical protein ACLB1O_25650 [Escherichia coli]
MVLTMVAPEGNCAVVVNYPDPVLGKKEVGVRRNSTAIPAQISR